MNKIACKNFRYFLHHGLCIKKSTKIYKFIFFWKKQPWFFFKIFLWLVWLKKAKNENCKIRHYSFKMTDNDLKIWQNHLLLNPFHMVDAKFDLVSRLISHGNPTMPFVANAYNTEKSACTKIRTLTTHALIYCQTLSR